ncbi:MAG: hypothetical protein J6Y02_23745 [Pseudobutyrivibrio sp.]|nr:hypothetical protein [Pseudobutyrivibrio sp.]
MKQFRISRKKIVGEIALALLLPPIYIGKKILDSYQDLRAEERRINGVDEEQIIRYKDAKITKITNKHPEVRVTE